MLTITAFEIKSYTERKQIDFFKIPVELTPTEFLELRCKVLFGDKNSLKEEIHKLIIENFGTCQLLDQWDKWILAYFNKCLFELDIDYINT